ncbi:2OG-Fe(II) oxygenase [Parvibaculum sp.]|uniref:2OG-Fe(II) oxygenase family protein n=1 Tax=Parvibaculum sp. TaxID=2024848 RepID=UPI001B1ACC34|nr:2OG-Fe(II) oxygenase [Parvibaculum sp.]MBO6633909.1 2OG-Fe(II) oxygenase [Parvibaculum sp.]MBO6679696.1 2OG-Fe(II) oxygenase [Parvibaculum sp.]MBO6684695.1 2OG-Fe(II) oxygenase [Parvibaculum sp.]MBO6905407.1 2OG-Fe(II) oxygenase [Parvibaculum sp.]
MSLIDIDTLRATPLKTEPYEYLVVPAFVTGKALDSVIADFPNIQSTGSIPPSELDIYGSFGQLLDEMNGPEFREAIEEKFGVDLTDRPTMFTVRGYCARNNGKIHTDTESKIITVLLYLNQDWEAGGGRLRILRSGTDLEDAAEEVSPNGGTLLIFKRSDKSWHGHEPFEGQRRAIQMNWVTDEDVVAHEQRRHRFTSTLKRLNPFGNRATRETA